MANYIEDALRSRLIADSAVAAIVVQRVYPRRLPLGTALPAIRYHRIDTPHTGTHDSDGKDLVQPRFQFDCIAKDEPGSPGYDKARELGRAVRIALNGFRGTLGAFRASVRVVNELDDYDAEVGQDRRLVDAVITFEEDVA